MEFERFGEVIEDLREGWHGAYALRRSAQSLRGSASFSLVCSVRYVLPLPLAGVPLVFTFTYWFKHAHGEGDVVRKGLPFPSSGVCLRFGLLIFIFVSLPSPLLR